MLHDFVNVIAMYSIASCTTEDGQTSSVELEDVRCSLYRSKIVWRYAGDLYKMRRLL